MTTERTRYRLGVDVGGTHTDLVLLDTTTGELSVEKVASTPKNPALGVLEGVGRFIAKGIPPSQIGFFAHGTTITTNALLEMRGAKVALLITQGYRAVQEIQNQARDGNLFDYFYSKPAAIAPRISPRKFPSAATTPDAYCARSTRTPLGAPRASSRTPASSRSPSATCSRL